MGRVALCDHSVITLFNCSTVQLCTRRVGLTAGCGQVAGAWQLARQFVAESKWSRAQSLLFMAKDGHDFPMLPSARLLREGREARAGGAGGHDRLRAPDAGKTPFRARPRSMTKLLKSLKEERDDDQWSHVLEDRPPVIAPFLRQFDTLQAPLTPESSGVTVLRRHVGALGAERPTILAQAGHGAGTRREAVGEGEGEGEGGGEGQGQG